MVSFVLCSIFARNRCPSNAEFNSLRKEVRGKNGNAYFQRTEKQEGGTVLVVETATLASVGIILDDVEITVAFAEEDDGV